MMMKRMTLALAAFLIAYVAVTLVWTTIQRRSLEVPEKDAIRVGEHVVLPKLEAVTGGRFPRAEGKPLLVTAFSVSCPFSAQSVPFWNRLKRVLPANYVVIGCARSIEELKTFARQTKFEGDLFFSTCGEAEARLKIGGGISHYLLDAHGVCQAVWTGMPVKPEYEEKMLAEIVQRVRRYSP